MKKILLAATVAALSSTSVFAADLAARPYTKAPAPAYVAPIYNWTGFYLGAHLGGAFAGGNNITDLDGAGYSASTKGGFLGGGQIGYNWQFSPNWVFGIEGDISGLDYKRSVVDGAGQLLQQKTDWLASVTGRLGYTWGPGMIYAKGGVAFRDNGGFSSTDPLYAVDNKSTGYTVGGGLEYMFAPAWSAKVEYQYYNFDKSNLYWSGAPAARYDSDIHTVKAGINYHFNWGGPVVAKY
ncbi:Opacity protein antigens OS=Afipia felis OX=1035 GN=NCTC12722_02118 PE=3 SV=1 [Afipia felis]